MSNLWLTADTHFGHAKIIGYAKRPFKNVDAMDEAIISNWNKVVGANDTVWHLGDFTLESYKYAFEYLRRLSGRINIIGNLFHHDKWIRECEEKRWIEYISMDLVVLKNVTSLTDHNIFIRPPIHTIRVGDRHIVMSHYPQEYWDRKHYNSIHTHGHSHNTSSIHSHRWDVGVDCWNFEPANVRTIIAMTKHAEKIKEND